MNYISHFLYFFLALIQSLRHFVGVVNKLHFRDKSLFFIYLSKHRPGCYRSLLFFCRYSPHNTPKQQQQLQQQQRMSHLAFVYLDILKYCFFFLYIILLIHFIFHLFFYLSSFCELIMLTYNSRSQDKNCTPITYHARDSNILLYQRIYA